MNKKDIVDQIIEKMKSTEELPYKEGAWENFMHRYQPVVPKRNKTFYWAASAAAILLIGFFSVRYSNNNVLNTEDQIVARTTGQSDNSNVPDQTQAHTDGLSAEQQAPNHIENVSSSIISSRNKDVYSLSSNMDEQRELQSLAGGHSVYFKHSIDLPLSLNSSSIGLQRSNLKLDESEYVLPSNEIRTEFGYSKTENIKGQEPELKSRKFQMREKFDLGLFVSPSSTNERFNFGGGVLLAYNINKNISVRTGLAYNKYDVSEMKDPIKNTETPIVASRDAIQKITAGGLTQQFMSSNAIVLPNVNAITGNVQALEIPLDIRVKTKDGFYASSGLTYAAVFNQNRYTHYVENANSELFENGLPENESEMKNAVQQVSRAIKTEDENINSNGFGGFVNFSIGKEMKVNKTMNISVEPYFKLPVGSFKRADMNYTNGGIRIITNF